MASQTPNLECRMYEAKYSEVDMAVMIQVKNSQHGRLRLTPRVQQHRGHDLVLRALAVSNSKRQQSHQSGSDRAHDGAPC
nr:eukaryotic translation initiation factor 2 subunit alpha like [Quercus suber]